MFDVMSMMRPGINLHLRMQKCTEQQYTQADQFVCGVLWHPAAAQHSSKLLADVWCKIADSCWHAIILHTH
jgi:hypothetical protein